MGPNESHNYEVYLRTAISVEADGWAQFGYVKMPDYRWGIFLQPRDEKREVNFGIHTGPTGLGKKFPAKYRSTLRRVDRHPGRYRTASVEQQRMLGSSCPSMYESAKHFSGHVEEGRHLWAWFICCIATSVAMAARKLNRFWRGARVTRIIRASLALSMNRRPTGWLFICLRFSTDRDGKFQLCALAESGFDPLARTCRFMLTEEAHHMLSARPELAESFSGLAK